jgi:RHS repeat-associated protein
VDPAGGQQHVTFDPARGLVTQAVNRRGQVVSMQYDTLGRLVQRQADGAATTWAYDPNGLWMSVSNGASTDTIRFDREGKMVEQVIIRGVRRYAVQRGHRKHRIEQFNFRYDTIAVTGPWGTRAIAYGDDDFGRVTSLRDFTQGLTFMSVNRESQVFGLSWPTAGTFRLGLSYDAEHRLSEVQRTSTVGPTAVARRYTYSNRGLVLKDSTGGGFGFRNQYGYDVLDRVTSWNLRKYDMQLSCTIHGGCTEKYSSTLVQSQAFAWDSVGNPKGSPIDPGNRLRSHAGFTMTYDADGNLIRKYNPTTGFDQQFTWNSLGQLTSVATSGQALISYSYDGLGRRVRRTQQFPYQTIDYVYDGDHLVLEVDGNGNLIREYTHFPGIDRPHSMRQWANGEYGAVYYYVLNQPGHVNALVNASDQLVNHYRYTPFGERVASQTSEGTENPLQYMARELDAVTGLYYVRNRWYDPQMGRFISEDPIGLAGGMNLYEYAASNPVSMRDPWGLAPCPRTVAGLVQAYMGWCEWPMAVVLPRVIVMAKADETGGGGGGQLGGGAHPGAGGVGGGVRGVPGEMPGEIWSPFDANSPELRPCHPMSFVKRGFEEGVDNIQVGAVIGGGTGLIAGGIAGGLGLGVFGGLGGGYLGAMGGGYLGGFVGAHGGAAAGFLYGVVKDGIILQGLSCAASVAQGR